MDWDTENFSVKSSNINIIFKIKIRFKIVAIVNLGFLSRIRKLEMENISHPVQYISVFINV